MDNIFDGDSPDWEPWPDDRVDDFHGTGGKSKPSFSFVAVGDLELKEPEFLIDGLIETDTLGQIFGDPASGKTFVAVDLAMCVATGAEFHGHTVKQGAVFYVAGEGHSGLARRFAAWACHHKRRLSDAVLFKSERGAQFLDADSAESVADAVAGLAAIHGHPAMIVVDTLARNFGPGDENSTQEMSAFIAAMDDLRARWPGSVILIVHHSGHADKQRARGAMALFGALDFEYRVAKNLHTVKLFNTKMKDADAPPVMCFSLDDVEIRQGISSAVLVATENDAAEEASTKLSKDALLARQTYVAAAVEHGLFGPDGLQGLELEPWRTVFYAAHTGDNTEAKKKAFQRGRSVLVERALMTVDNDIYLTSEVGIRLAIAMERKAGQAGRDGTKPDIVPDIERDGTGHTPKGVSRCPGVPIAEEEKADVPCPACEGVGCEWCE